MDKVFSSTMLIDRAEESLFECIDYISNNRIYSTWTKKICGWQELWLQSKYTGLYATCNAILVLLKHKDRYLNVLNDAIKEMEYLFDDSIEYPHDEKESKEEQHRKARCRLLLEQNSHITLKAVYFIRTYEQLKKNNITISDTPKFHSIVETVYSQIEKAYDCETGFFCPAVDNSSDISVLTTMQAFLVMKNRWGLTKRIVKTKRIMMDSVNEYRNRKEKGFKDIDNKFEEYSIKRNFIASLYALSHSVELLGKEDIDKLVEAVFLSLDDDDVRNGFSIKDSYTVPNTVIARDTYTIDSRLLYIKSILVLIKNNVLPFTIIESFLDDLNEIIETSHMKHQYMAWDSSPSFSHNIRGIFILDELVELFAKMRLTFHAYEIYPSIHNNKSQVLNPKSVVLFMKYNKPYSSSVVLSVEEVLSAIGFNTWLASNDPYDAMVFDSIAKRLSEAQFAIIDCHDRSGSVMYEAGLAHGLGKLTLLCGSDDNCFPYENKDSFQACIYDCNGEDNPPPYRDLQQGILDYVINNIESFCLTEWEKNDILQKVNMFKSKHFIKTDEV